MTSSRFFSFPICATLLLLLTLYRIVVLSQSSFDLYPDEAQYWFWSLTPDWGYYSKPPMVAWLITATTSLCGNTEFCVRLSASLLHFFTALCVYGIASTLYQDRLIAWCSGLAYATLPAVSLSSLLISTDVPFLFFWALTVFGFVKAITTTRHCERSEAIQLERRGRDILDNTAADAASLDCFADARNDGIWWLLAGVAAGFGLLSKYTMIIFLPSALLALWLIPSYRHYFAAKGLYLAMLLAALIYLPNLIWNYHHGFVSYLHTKDNAHLEAALFHPLQMLEFISSQFGVFGPILFGGLLVVLIRYFPQQRRNFITEEATILLCLTLPFLLLITSISLLSRAHANWAAPVYITATVLVVAWLVNQRHYRLLIASFLLHLSVMGISYHYEGIKHLTHIPERKATDPFRSLRGWEPLGKAVGAIQKQYPGTTLLTNDRKIITSLHYYIKPLPSIIKWNADGQIQDHFELTTTMEGKEGQDFLLVVKQGQAGDIPSYFKQAKLVTTLKIQIYEDYIIPYDIYRLESFKGY